MNNSRSQLLKLGHMAVLGIPLLTACSEASENRQVGATEELICRHSFATGFE